MRSGRSSSASDRSDGVSSLSESSGSSDDDSEMEGCGAGCPKRAGVLSRIWLTTAPWTKNILAVWHTYLLCVAACAIACASLVVVLFWHVEWYHHYDPSATDLDFTLHFLAAFVKSWLLIGTTSELLRFCYLLSVDAWRIEMFEAYRRAMCFASFAEIAAGSLYVCGWPAPIPMWRKVADLILQVLIHVSLDILPVVMVVVDIATWRNNFELSSAMLAIACIHVVLFWAAWTIGDLTLKIVAFSAACRAKVLKVSYYGTATKVLRFPAQEVEKNQPENILPGWELQNTFIVEEVDLEDTGGRFRARSQTIALPYNSYNSEEDTFSQSPQHSAASEPIPRRRTVSQRHMLINDQALHNAPSIGTVGGERPLDCCLPLCVCLLHFFEVFPMMFSLGVILVGGSTGHAPLIFLGLEAVVLIMLGMLLGQPQLSDLSCWPSGPRIKALQDWGDEFCGFRYEDQLHFRLPFIFMTYLLGLLAGVLNWWYSMSYCAAVLLLCFLVQIAVLIQKPWVWLFGLLESLGLMLASCAILWASPVLTPAEDCGLILFFSVCRQFGMRRALSSGGRVQLLALALLCLFQMALVTVISFCIANHRTVGANPMFCDPTSPGCQYYDIGYIGDLGGRWPICEIAFRTGPYDDADLTLADFALMSAFTYEPPSHVAGLLHQYFPHWRVSYRHIPIMLTGTFDWTSFYEFTAGDNSTSIFAVRGTTDMFDALQDMDLWLPVGMMYVFERLGPSVIQLWGPGIAWICRHVYVQQDGNFSLSFLNLLNMVKSRMTSFPNRTYYITGHSLGGGIAKLVAAEVLRQELRKPGPHVEMTAIAFASPGIGVAEALLFGSDMKSTNRLTSITVQPQNDLVSRIDHNTGSTIPVACQGNPRRCHSVYATLCSMYRNCGSKRPHSRLQVPCGWCEDMPCATKT